MSSTRPAGSGVNDRVTAVADDVERSLALLMTKRLLRRCSRTVSIFPDGAAKLLTEYFAATTSVLSGRVTDLPQSSGARNSRGCHAKIAGSWTSRKS